jgi:hypothetical protein
VGSNRFAAHVLLENVVGRRFIDRIGHVLSTQTRGGVSEVLFAADRADETVR